MNGTTGRRLGLIVRADEGGLGTQTLEYARHLQPSVVLVVEVIHAEGVEPRGAFIPERYLGLAPRILHTRYPLSEGAGQEFWDLAQSTDVILTAETPYRADFPDICAETGTALVVHANPELWEWGMRPPFEVWKPTTWLDERLPGDVHMPVPVDRERCAPREVTEVRNLLHVSSPAMMDRNGTELLVRALAFCRSSFTLHVSGPKQPPALVRMARGVCVRPVGRQADYWRVYEGMDALVLPRRYGGLCLPMQEAASCGLPVIAPSVSPQASRLALGCSVPGKGGGMVMTKGGPVQMWDVDPELLAHRIDRLVDGDSLEEGRAASAEWAELLDWEGWAPLYDGGLKHAADQQRRMA